MTIRNATFDDLITIHEIEVLCFGDGAYPLFVIRQFYDIASKYFLVATLDEKIIGYALGSLSAQDAQGWILSVGVHPNARGNQMGTKLIKKLMSLLEFDKANELCLTVHPDNKSAITIYKSLSFEITMTYDNYYLDNQPRYLMTKKSVTTPLNT